MYISIEFFAKTKTWARFPYGWKHKWVEHNILDQIKFCKVIPQTQAAKRLFIKATISLNQYARPGHSELALFMLMQDLSGMKNKGVTWPSKGVPPTEIICEHSKKQTLPFIYIIFYAPQILYLLKFPLDSLRYQRPEPAC